MTISMNVHHRTGKGAEAAAAPTNGRSPMINGGDADSDTDQLLKYKKKRRKQLNQLLALHHPAVRSTGVVVLFGTILVMAVWHFSAPPPLALVPPGQDALMAHDMAQASPPPVYGSLWSRTRDWLWPSSDPLAATAGDVQSATRYFSKLYEDNVEEYVSRFLNTHVILTDMIDEIERRIKENLSGGIRWAAPYLLPPLPDEGWSAYKKLHQSFMEIDKLLASPVLQSQGYYFWAYRNGDPAGYKWKEEWRQLQAMGISGPAVDYTPRDKYIYPPVMLEPPPADQYPKLRPMKELFDRWPQDQDAPGRIEETLAHFDFMNPLERAAALRYRELEVPFKMYNVPEFDRTAAKWTDEYLSAKMDDPTRNKAEFIAVTQESVDNFFVFFTNWDVHTLGIPPVRLNDMPYHEWAEHARYADAVSLSAQRPHFYYQCGDFTKSRWQENNTFYGLDIPSFGAREDNFWVFNVTGQMGIQCRMGERGVAVATHHDMGRNWVAMFHGAKRYVLSPPNQCDKLALVPQPTSPMWRHSALNFGHLSYLNDPKALREMPERERLWLERAATARTVDTVVKAGEALYIPAHWFHYIIGLQKSTQCNVRSGDPETEGYNPAFGDIMDVSTCGQDWGLEDPRHFHKTFP